MTKKTTKHRGKNNSSVIPPSENTEAKYISGAQAEVEREWTKFSDKNNSKKKRKKK